MKLKIKKLKEEAILPRYSRPGDAGLDLFSVEEYLLKAGERRLFMLGIALEVETGNVYWFGIGRD